jgi:hypothetical protein
VPITRIRSRARDTERRRRGAVPGRDPPARRHRCLPAAIVDEYLTTGDIAVMVTLCLRPSTWHSNDDSGVM